MLMYPAQTTQMQPKYRAEYWDWVMCEAYSRGVSAARGQSGRPSADKISRERQGRWE
jgi:hypothetical protein